MYSPAATITSKLESALDFPPENLNLSIISGSLSLTSSSLKPSLLSSTSYILVSSHIGTITASIPWRTLIFSNASIQISDVTIVLAVKGTSGGERRREERERMQEEIRRAEEYFREGREDVQEIAEEITREKASFLSKLSSGFASSLFTRLISNLTITLTNLRVVLINEDMSIGVTVGSVVFDNKCRSGGVFGEKKRRKTNQEDHDVNKRFKIEEFAVFIKSIQSNNSNNPPSTSTSSNNPSSSDIFFPDGDSDSDSDYFLLPMDVDSKIGVHSTLIDDATGGNANTNSTADDSDSDAETPNPQGNNLSFLCSLDPLNLHLTRQKLLKLTAFNETIKRVHNGRPIFSPLADANNSEHERLLAVNKAKREKDDERIRKYVRSKTGDPMAIYNNLSDWEELEAEWIGQNMKKQTKSPVLYVKDSSDGKDTNKEGVYSPRNSIRAWWVYAFWSVLREIKENRRGKEEELTKKKEELMRMEDMMSLEQILICRRLEQKRAREGKEKHEVEEEEEGGFSPIKQMQSFATSSLGNPDSYRSFILTKAVTKAKSKIKRIKEKIDVKLAQQEEGAENQTVDRQQTAGDTLDEASKKEFDLITEDLRAQLRRFNRTKSNLPPPTSAATSTTPTSTTHDPTPTTPSSTLNLQYNVKIHFQSISLKLIEVNKVKKVRNSSFARSSRDDEISSSDDDFSSSDDEVYNTVESPVLNLNFLGLLLSTSASLEPTLNFSLKMNNACLVGEKSRHLMSVGSAESAWMCCEEEYEPKRPSKAWDYDESNVLEIDVKYTPTPKDNEDSNDSIILNVAIDKLNITPESSTLKAIHAFAVSILPNPLLQPLITPPKFADDIKLCNEIEKANPTMKKGPERPPNERLRASHIQNVLRNQVVTTLDFKFKGVELLIPTSTSSHHRYFRFHVKSGKVHIGKFQVEEDENKTTPKQKWKNLIKLANRQSTNTEGQHDMQEKIKDFIDSTPPNIFQQTTISLVGIDATFLDKDLKSSLSTAMLKAPFNTRILISDCLVPGLKDQPRQRVGVFCGDVEFSISKQRLHGLCALQNFAEDLQNSLTPPTPPTQTPPPPPLLPPRIESLSEHILLRTTMSLQTFRIDFVNDIPSLSTHERTVLLNVSVYEYLSQISTNLAVDMKGKVANYAMVGCRQLFVDKCLGIGLDFEDARRHAIELEDRFVQSIHNLANQAEVDNFYNERDRERSFDSADVDSQKSSPAHSPIHSPLSSPTLIPDPILSPMSLARKLSRKASYEKSENEKLKLDRSRTKSETSVESNDDSEEEGQVYDVLSDSEEESDPEQDYADNIDSDDSSINSLAHANKITKAAISEAMDFYVKAIEPGVLESLEKNSFNPQIEQLCVEFKFPTVNFLQHVYDDSLIFIAKSLTIRNGAGVYFLRLKGGDQTVGNKLYSNEAISKFMSKPTFGESPVPSPRHSSPSKKIGKKFTKNSQGEKPTNQEVISAAARHSKKKDFGLKVTRINQDAKYGFRIGGHEKSVLNDEATATQKGSARRREANDHILMNAVDFVLCPSAMNDVLNMMNEFKEIADAQTLTESNAPDPRAPLSLPKSLHVTTLRVAAMSMLFVSNEVSPFTKVDFKTFSFEQTLPPNSELQALIKSKAEGFSMYNLTPEGQSYQNVISTLPTPPPPTPHTPNTKKPKKQSPFFLEMFQYHNFWKTPARVNIIFSKVKLTVLYRWVNEAMQYFINEEMMLGMFIKNYFPELRDAVHNLPPPMMWSVLLKESTILMPRNSSSKDMVALQPEDMYIFKSLEQDSWFHSEVDSSDDDLFEDSSPIHATASMLVESDDSDSTDSSDEFADAKANDDLSFKSAFDRDSSFDSDTSTSTNLDIDSSIPLSAYHTELIDRITVQCKSLRLLAGLGDKLEDDDIPFQDLVTLIGTASMNPIKDGNEVYIGQDNSEIDTKDAPASPHHPAHHDNALSTTKWTELTNKDGEGVELEIVIDWHPHKRIQLSDFVPSKRETPPPFKLSVTQAQFYLLLSLWYSNMQELPVMFPFSESEMEEYSVQPDPPVDWPEYGTKQWLKRVTREAHELNFEFLLRFRDISLNCAFDQSFFEISPECLFMCKSDKVKRAARFGLPDGKGFKVRDKGTIIICATPSTPLFY
ncbi:hypothetical protein TL16_g12541 [Triparma laevis f. inornata]|uniref:Autophagy-related protein 2 n=1 Tax=Triparma laevis f. inornata TaxID=1714386 RepID=A0A9W7BRA0_9STRA|nr:hypothetical protein TL16_g12541 [Triparma laevis f. inornata]